MLYAAPIVTAASEIVKIETARPEYIGLPCSREPGVPPPTSTSSMLPSKAQLRGMRLASKRMLCDPEPLSPSMSPQSSSIFHSLRGATNSSCGGGSCGLAPAGAGSSA